jgi:hypothetical protein
MVETPRGRAAMRDVGLDPDDPRYAVDRVFAPRDVYRLLPNAKTGAPEYYFERREAD